MDSGKKRQVWRIAVVVLSWPVCLTAGTLLGYWYGRELGRGKDSIFPPEFWTTPLGLVFGVIFSAVLVSVVALIGREK